MSEDILSIGQKVEAREGTLARHCGDRFGVVERFDRSTLLVRMEYSKRLVPFKRHQLKAASHDH